MGPNTNVNICEILKNSLLNILEQHSFLFLDPLPEDDIFAYLKKLKKENNLQDKDYLCIKMNFVCDNKNGTFTLYLSVDCAVEIEANLLGKDIDEVDINQCCKDGDSAKEILNILSANILNEIYGSKPQRNLSIPECMKISFIKVIENINKVDVRDSDNKKNFIASMIINQYPILLHLNF
ncbi:MAG: hypothetical protein HQK49_09755 [Oligoflexia bacterium]|nr:hypothetical protein [Oligoflexia bacterium]